MQLFVRSTQTDVLHVFSDATGSSLRQAVEVNTAAMSFPTLCAEHAALDLTGNCSCRRRQACQRARSGSALPAAVLQTTSCLESVESDLTAAYKWSIDYLVEREVSEPCCEGLVGLL